MKNILLIVGISEQYYFKPLIEKCWGKSMKIFILDPHILKKSAINITISKSGDVGGFVDVWEYRTVGMKKVRLPILDINIAWYLREGINKSKPDNSLETRFVENESRGVFRSLLSILNCKWVNRKETIDFISSNKFYQQSVARKCGLSIPRTIISNDPKSVALFSDTNKGLLLKTIGYINLDETGQSFIYSQRFSHEELVVNKKAICHCPIFAQEYIEKLYEHRVMVIGRQVLSCRIDSQASEKTKIDWRRYDFENVAHTASQLPVSVQDSLKHFMDRIELKYGAIDLVETPEKEFIFLEVNPSGQWGWIADLAGIPIPEAVADMLESL